MTDAGYYRGTTADQDTRFQDKNKKLMKTLKFSDTLNEPVDMRKVKLDAMKPWIHEKMTEILGFEDDVVIDYAINQLEETNTPDPKTVQINLTGFLNAKNARLFMAELWPMLVSAQSNPHGIPEKLIEMKRQELEVVKADAEKMQQFQSNIQNIAETLKKERRGSDAKELASGKDERSEIRIDERRGTRKDDRKERRSHHETEEKKRRRSGETTERKRSRSREKKRSRSRERKRRSRSRERKRRSRSRDRKKSSKSSRRSRSREKRRERTSKSSKSEKTTEDTTSSHDAVVAEDKTENNGGTKEEQTKRREKSRSKSREQSAERPKSPESGQSDASGSEMEE